MSLNKKFVLRLQIIFGAALFRILFLFSNLIISLFIVRTQSAELWGNVVHYLLILDLGFAVINWGHSPYLTREFSLQPALMQQRLSGSISSRSFLLIIFLFVLWILPVQPVAKIALMAWSIFRFLYQAFDPVLQYHRNYKFASLVELTGIAVVIVPLVFGWFSAAVENILFLFTASFGIRSLATLVYNRKFLDGKLLSLQRPRISLFLKPAFPFLLLTFSAMLQQRADLYVVAFYLDDKTVASYQVLINLLLVGQLGASLLLSPFSKNIFRLPKASFLKLERNFMRAGVVITFVTTLLIFAIVRFIYGFELPWTLYAMAYIYGLMFYLYLMRNFQLGKAYRQLTVAGYSLAGFAVNLCFSVVLTPRLGIEGAMLSGVLTQLFIATLYFRRLNPRMTYAAR